MMNKTDSQAAIKSPFVLLPEVVKMTNQPRSTILKYTKTGQFPQVIRLLGNRIAFSRADVQNWIDKRVTSTQEAK